MDWYASIAKHLIHPIWAVKDGERHIGFWKKLERSQYSGREELQALQLERLKRLVSHAYNNCDFYRRRFSENDISPIDIKKLSDIEKLPFLTKEDIQFHKDEMVAGNIPRRDLLEDKTGGSTGKPLRYYRDRRRMDYLRAATMRHDRWAGYEVGDKLAVIWGNRHDFSPMEGLKWEIRNRLLERKLILDSSYLTEEKMMTFAHDLRAFAPKAMLAYANSGALFAQYLLENKVNGIHLHSVITSAEVLHAHERELIERAFSCRVFNRYGCREVGVIASECEAHDGLHLNAESLLVEFVHEGKAVAPGEQGDIVITDLLNFGMPLIRYRIEDIGIPCDRSCSCGRNLPLMKMVAGRSTDFLKAPDGRRISGASLTIYLIANTPGIGQAQIIQDAPDELLLRIVRKPDFTEDSRLFIRKKVQEFFGSDMKLSYEYPHEIPKEASGKYRFSICKI